MHRKAIVLCGSCVLVLSIWGCETPGQKREKVTREESEAVRAQREMAEEVRQEKEQAQEKIGEARKDATEKVSEEYAHQERKVGEEMEEAREARGELAEERTTERGEKAGKLPRFEAIRNESNLAFAMRADARLAIVAADIAVLTEQAKLVATEKRDEMNKELSKANEAYAEAVKDLDEVRNRTGSIVDDGRLGVAMAINRAQRKLENVREDMVGTIY